MEGGQPASAVRAGSRKLPPHGRGVWLILSLVLFTLSVLDAIPAGAHDLGVARVELRENRGMRYELDATVTSHGPFSTGTPVFPERCVPEGSPAVMRRPGLVVLRFKFSCSGSPLGSGDVIELPWGREGAFVTMKWLDGSAHSQFFGSDRQSDGEGRVKVLLSRPREQPDGPMEVAASYFLLGIEHILTGWDHLAFVLCLCLVARGWRLLRLITGFTIGHSLSLALAAFDVVRLPSPPVEACIAMSIAFVARDSLLPVESHRHGPAIVFAFGLLHGLGFAGALQEAGIGRAELLLGLLTFNFGVEAGQLVFVAAALTIMAVGTRAAPRPEALRVVCATGLGMLAVFWTLQRVFVF